MNRFSSSMWVFGDVDFRSFGTIIDNRHWLCFVCYMPWYIQVKTHNYEKFRSDPVIMSDPVRSCDCTHRQNINKIHSSVQEIYSSKRFKQKR